MSDAFPETYWTLIRRGSRTVLERIATDYAAPVRRFAERHGFTPEDAEDLAQETLSIVCDPKFLDQADSRKGKFRTLVLLVVKNVMNDEWRKRYAKKRRGKAVSLDDATIAEILAAPEPADEDFDREWWKSLLEEALSALQKDNPRRHRILRLHKMEERPHGEIAEELGIPPDQVNNEIRAGKKRLREILLDRIRAYCSTPGEYEGELARFRKALG